MTSIPRGSWFVPPEVPRWFDRRADGFRHAATGGLWLAPLVFLERARFGPGWYGKVVSADPDRLLAWAISKGIPQRALQVKSLPDVDMPRATRLRLHPEQSGRPLHATGCDQVGKAHGQPDQNGALPDRGQHVVQLVAEFLEQLVGDRFGAFQKGIVAGMADVVAI